MKGNNQIPSEVMKDLYDFLLNNGNWITQYADYATEFNTDMVERKLSSIDLDDMLEDCTVLILTANAVEQNILTVKLYNEVNANINNKKKLSEIYADDCVYQFASIRNINIVHMHPNSTASYTSGGSADAVKSALERFRPKLVVSLGVAFGIDPINQSLGDVLLSSAIIPYDVFNKDKNSKIKLRPNDKYITHEALNAWNVLMRTPKFSLEKQESGRRSLIDKEISFQWQYGTMLSGGSVLSNERKKRALLRAAKDIGEDVVIGGEMEGAGVYSECKKPDIPCIVIKGICDWGAEKNSWGDALDLLKRCSPENGIFSSCEDSTMNDTIKDCVQAYAMDHATEALFRFLRFDSNFLDAYSPTMKNSLRRKYKRLGKFEKVKQFFALREDLLFKFVQAALVAYPLIYFFNNIIKNNAIFAINEVVYKIIYIFEIFLLMSIVCILAIKEKMEPHPIEIHHEWVNFSFDVLNLEDCTACIILNDSRPIFHVVASWWLSVDKINKGIQEIGTIKGNQLIEITALNVFNRNTILQVEYELANGGQYIHLISKKPSRKWVRNGSIVYCERIYRKDKFKNKLVDIQNEVIHHVINDNGKVYNYIKHV